MNEIGARSFKISLAYVGVGTIALFAMGNKTFNQHELISGVISLVNIVTMPVCFLGFGILYGSGKEAWLTALVAQLIIFVLFWYLLYKYLTRQTRQL